MSACPFCFSTMRSTFTGGLHRERCGRCGSLWIEGESLASVLGARPVEQLTVHARGRPGECKDCHRALQAGEQTCPQCKRDAPTCPRCHTAPLSIAELAGTKVDVCTGCHGLGLDPGELDMLLRAADLDGDGIPDDQDGDGLPDKEPAAPEPLPRKRPRPTCTECSRKVRLDYSFVWAGKFYCGTCAPKGAAPSTQEEGWGSPALASTLQLTEEIQLATTDPITFAVKWFFAKLSD